MAHNVLVYDFVPDYEALHFQNLQMMIRDTDLQITTKPGMNFIPRVNSQPFINVISLGAGKQSSYMLLTALEGAYEFKPDFAIFSDTGCEPDYVYSYVTWLKDYVKTKYNFDIVTVSAGNIIDDTVDYLEGKKTRVAQLPLFLANGGFVMRQCTNDYKIAPLRKYLQSVRNGNKIRLWIGISFDEIERIRDSSVKYIENYYPLIKKQIKIDQIINWFRETEIREPGKSACLICPFHSQNYWRVFKKQFPIEFEKACKFDDKIRNYPKLKNKAYLSNRRKPLREIDFSQHPSLFPELIEECTGLCGL